jgi:hypothetical protein
MLLCLTAMVAPACANHAHHSMYMQQHVPSEQQHQTSKCEPGVDNILETHFLSLHVIVKFRM